MPVQPLGMDVGDGDGGLCHCVMLVQQRRTCVGIAEAEKGSEV